MRDFLGAEQLLSFDHLWPNLTSVCIFFKPVLPSVSTVSLYAILRAKLVNKTLGIISLFDDTLLVVLANGATKFVIIHCWSVLPLAPKPGNMGTVLNLEDPLGAVQPADTAPVVLRL